jgi:DNA adenine methylase
LKSPLRYPGGKTRAIKHLLPHIPEGDICSPFLGGGSLELLLSEDRKVYAYDAFYPLYNFWHCLLNNKKELVKEVRKLHPIDKEGFKALRVLLSAYSDKQPLNPVMAAAYFAINRSSYSGATLSGGFSQQAADGRFNENSIKRLEDFEAPNLKVGYKSFEESIELHKNEFLYLDPPYFLGGKKDKLYGKAGDMHEGFDHELLHLLLTNRKNWLLCYNRCDYITNLYSGYDPKDAEWTYGMKNTISRTDQKKKKLLRQKQKESLAKIGELTQKFSTLSEEKQESKINRCSINIQKQLDSFQKIEEQISEFKQEMKESSEIIIISRG